MFELVAENYRAIIVWPADAPPAGRMHDRSKTWLAAQAGDVVWLRGEMETIKAVSLCRAHPTDQNDRVVTSAAAWLAGCCRQSWPA
jgi:hypothetical protein